MAEGTGIRIEAYLRERGTVPPAKAVRIAVDLLAQVHALAAEGSSRAISGIGPSRILISPEGKVVLLDPEDELPATVSAPAYASPEEIRGSAPDGRSAIYSIGCALFEMLTGRPPFAGEDPKAILRAHLSEGPPDVTAFRPDISPEIGRVVSWFLGKDPTQRPADPAKASEVLRIAFSRTSTGISSFKETQGIEFPKAPRAAPSPPRAAAPNIPETSWASSSSSSKGIRSGGSPPAARTPPPSIRRSPLPAPRGAAPQAPGPLGLRTSRFPKLGGNPLRRRLGAPVHDSHDRESYAPPPKPRWIFTWFGLAAGLLLALILIANAVMKSEGTSSEPTGEEKILIAMRMAEFKKSVDKDQNTAEAEFNGLETNRATLIANDWERIESISQILDRYAHTPKAFDMVKKIEELRGRAEERAAEGESIEPIPGSQEAASGQMGTQPPPPASDGNAEEKKASSPDDIGVQPGGDDGKKEL